MTWDELGLAIAKMSPEQSKQQVRFAEPYDSGQCLPVVVETAMRDVYEAWGDEKDDRELSGEENPVVVKQGMRFLTW